MSAPKYDVVLGWHMNPATCGVAKFNHRLAREMGVPYQHLSHARVYNHPLTSIKSTEIGPDWRDLLPAHGDLLLHDRPSHVPSGRRVVYADEIGCPSTIDGNPSRGRYRVLTFGMAHKRVLSHYVDLKAYLDAHHPDYTLEMSTAIHEGTPWDEGLAQSIVTMRGVFGDKLRVLGFLGDDAIAKELQECDAVAVYFDPAFRANNTSAWAAIQAGKTLFTNRDQWSPVDLPTWAHVVDILGRPAEAESMIPSQNSETAA